MRKLLILPGVLCVVLGFIGLNLPVISGIPLLVVADFCFARSSPRLHHWLLSHPTFGPPVAHWQAHGTIRTDTKIGSTTSLAVVFGILLIANVRPLGLWLAGAALALILIFIWTRRAS